MPRTSWTGSVLCNVGWLAVSLASTHWLQVASSVPACNDKLPPHIARCPLEGTIATGAQPNAGSQTFPCAADVCLQTESVVPALCAGTVAPTGSSVRGIFFPGKDSGAGCHVPLQGGLPNPGIELMSPASPALAGFFCFCFFHVEPHGKPNVRDTCYYC